MRKSTLITAVLLMIIGLILFTGVMAVYGFDFRKLGTVEYMESYYTFNDNVENISINTETADVTLHRSEDDTVKVEIFEEEKCPHKVTLKGNTLSVEIENNKNWYDYISINFTTPEIRIYIPEKDYESLKVCLSTGDVDIPKFAEFNNIKINGDTGDVRCAAFASDNVDITLSTGNVYLENMNTGDIGISQSTGKTEISRVSCDNLKITGDTGNIELYSVIANEKFFFERSTGDIEFDSCDAGEISIKTSTGDIEGSLLSGKLFVTETSTGDVEVPQSTNGGRCEIRTSTGDIEIEVR